MILQQLQTLKKVTSFYRANMDAVESTSHNQEGVAKMAARSTRKTAAAKKKAAATEEGVGRRGRTSDLGKYELFAEWAEEEHGVTIDPEQAQFTILQYKNFQQSDLNKEYNDSKRAEREEAAAERESRAAERAAAREEKAAKKATPTKKTAKRTTKKTAAASSAPPRKTAAKKTAGARRTTKKAAAATEAF